MAGSIRKMVCFSSVTIALFLTVGNGVLARDFDLLDDHDHSPGKRVTVSIDLPVMPCSTIRHLVTHADQRGGELEIKIREILGKWADHFPITDEDRKDFQEKQLLARPFRDDQKSFAFARELLSGYVLQECKQP